MLFQGGGLLNDFATLRTKLLQFWLSFKAPSSFPIVVNERMLSPWVRHGETQQALEACNAENADMWKQGSHRFAPHQPGGYQTKRHWEQCQYCFRRTKIFSVCKQCGSRGCSRWCIMWDLCPCCWPIPTPPYCGRCCTAVLRRWIDTEELIVSS
jgi:hypothetical protein